MRHLDMLDGALDSDSDSVTVLQQHSVITPSGARGFTFMDKRLRGSSGVGWRPVGLCASSLQRSGAGSDHGAARWRRRRWRRVLARRAGGYAAGHDGRPGGGDCVWLSLTPLSPPSSRGEGRPPSVPRRVGGRVLRWRAALRVAPTIRRFETHKGFEKWGILPPPMAMGGLRGG